MKPKDERYTIAIDFDGVLHSYTSPWVNEHTIPDPPVPGAIEWLINIERDFRVVVHSTRCKTWRGRMAVRRWLVEHIFDAFFVKQIVKHNTPDAFSNMDIEEEARIAARVFVARFKLTNRKPAALVYIDDRAWRFNGTNFPTAMEIHAARPWNKASAR